MIRCYAGAAEQKDWDQGQSIRTGKTFRRGDKRSYALLSSKAVMPRHGSRREKGLIRTVKMVMPSDDGQFLQGEMSEHLLLLMNCMIEGRSSRQ